MRTRSTAAAAALTCLLTGSALSGCAEGDDPQKEVSAQQLLDDANAAMRKLKSVTSSAVTTRTDGNGFSSRLTTDLDSTCTFKMTWENTGAALEQIRIGDTDYVRPNRAYIENWSGKRMAGSQDRWIKTPTSEARRGDGLADCAWKFTSFGTAKKGGVAKVDGIEAVELVVTDKKDKSGTYTFSVATEGEPYILKVVYKGTDYRTTTTYSGFDKPLGVRAPTKALDASKLSD
ncbi:hypothetical protein ABZ835_45700 [Streptomyces sp. NPDC047461]|uniref:hypothetical protein n=1 Tax=Streptomyces sp. NPDC047461 TaxID=3155619 RepID=UPI0033F2FB16